MPVSGCLVQCHSVWFWTQYDSAVQPFMLFQYSHSVMQLMTAYAFHVTAKILALTGFRLLFFHGESFIKQPHQTPTQAFQIVQARWTWFTDRTKYSGPAADFPLALETIPGVPIYFSFKWLHCMRGVLWLRMFATIVVAITVTFNASYLSTLISSLHISAVVPPLTLVLPQ